MQPLINLLPELPGKRALANAHAVWTIGAFAIVLRSRRRGMCWPPLKARLAVLAVETASVRFTRWASINGIAFAARTDHLVLRQPVLAERVAFPDGLVAVGISLFHS